MAKTFVLGVGAQKAGTSWLHKYLADRSDFNEGFTKEYHIFDAINVPSAFRFRAQVEERALNMIGKGLRGYRDKRIIKRLAFISDPQMYFAYFTDLLHAPEVRATGDITPVYSALKPDTLEFIKTEFEKRGVAVRPIFLMRDPVDRLNSMVRMAFRRIQQVPSYEDELRVMNNRRGAFDDSIRSDYHNTINTLEQVFGANVYLGFYEELFCDESVRTICDFIGLPFSQPNYIERVNANQTGNVLTDEDVLRFADSYRQQIEFCASRFGRDRIKSIWRSAAILEEPTSVASSGVEEQRLGPVTRTMRR